jgi:hypothetical protein
MKLLLRTFFDESKRKVADVEEFSFVFTVNAVNIKPMKNLKFAVTMSQTNLQIIHELLSVTEHLQHVDHLSLNVQM